MLRVGIITGSARPGRNNEAVADWIHGLAKDCKDAEFEVVDIAHYKLPLFNEPVLPIMSQYAHEHTKKWSEKIASFDAYVFVTPEYNHSTSGALKNAIDRCLNVNCQDAAIASVRQRVAKRHVAAAGSISATSKPSLP
jgi:NAD(P)H-dependent FMN reductase